jgi:CBS domain-containing protein
MTIPIRSILARKGWGALTVAPGEPVMNVADILVSNQIGSLPVVSESGKLLGLISERDLVTAMSQHHGAVGSLTASDIMMRTLHSCSMDCTLIDAMQMMTTHRQRHIPVVEDERLIGVVSIGDIVKFRLEEADQMVEEMRAYVMQGEPGQDPGSGRYATR